MTKKEYLKPSTEVVVLNHQQPLLAGSGLNAPSDYIAGDDPFEEELAPLFNDVDLDSYFK